MKLDKRQALLSSLLFLLPIAAGLYLWPQLYALTADTAACAMQVFTLPLVMLATHWLCLYLVLRDNRHQNAKVVRILYWLLPIMALFVSAISYMITLGRTFSITRLWVVPLSAVFIVCGNYFPKFRPNRTMGIRIPWTLANEENWNRTHRFAAKIWVVGGLVLLFSVFLPMKLSFLLSMLAIVVLSALPIAYSYRLYRAHRAAGIEYTIAPRSPAERKLGALSGVLCTGIIVFAVAMMFTGHVKPVFGADSVTFDASFWPDRTIVYEQVESITYRDSCPAGERVNGVGSPRLLVGLFRNDEFGAYTRYTYAGCDECIELHVGGQTVVVNGVDADATQALYDELMQHIS